MPITLSEYGLVETKAGVLSVGDTYGKLTVLAKGQKPGTYRYLAVCRCACGKTGVVVRLEALRSGSTQSCGCLRKEKTTTHGLSSSPHYGRWRFMIDRCYNSHCFAFPDYGLRGIKVCNAWHDLTTYVSQLPPGYQPGLQLDRIDNNGDYEPGNVRWSTPQENSNNRRSRREITFNGETRSISEWAAKVGVRGSTLIERINYLGWSAERALTDALADKNENMLRAQKLRWRGHTKKPAPPPRVLKRFEYDGQHLTIAEISERTGITINLLRKRICERGWSIERATQT